MFGFEIKKKKKHSLEIIFLIALFKNKIIVNWLEKF